jgi:formylglycine-generating enzyme required for sulfatase activity
MFARSGLSLLLLVLFCGLSAGCAGQVLAAGKEIFTNSIGMKFVTIPAGGFFMGSCKAIPPDEESYRKQKFMGSSALFAKVTACPSGAIPDNDAYDDETPQHRVHISKNFMMGVYEVTLGQFKQFIAAAGRTDLLTDEFMKYNNNGDNAAVVQVSWNHAQDFIRWLNRKEGKNYRLPTEAEWEYAARAGSTAVYSFGDNKAELGQYAWYGANSGGHVHQVGQLRPNGFGLYDMYGNVWEWCSDWSSDNYCPIGPVTDPQGPSSGTYRVGRGGGWGGNPGHLRSANRNYDSPDVASYYLGFRLLLPVQ